MKLCHAALALVGWYLMVPPQASVRGKWNAGTKEYDVYTTAPLSDWQILGSSDAAEECRTELAKWNVQAKVGCPKCFVPGECVATDDSRLKGR